MPGALEAFETALAELGMWAAEGKLLLSVFLAGSALDSFLLNLGMFDFGEPRQLIPLWLAALSPLAGFAADEDMVSQVYLEFDPETGEFEIVRYVACDDAGNIVNHQIVEGQMQGGITQGAGHIFGEQAVYDESGQLLTGSFMDYPMPRAVLVNNLTVLDYPVPTKTNPLGAKGVGEAGVTGSMPCLMNAVMDALRQGGVQHFDMPASAPRLWSALRAARGRA